MYDEACNGKENLGCNPIYGFTEESLGLKIRIIRLVMISWEEF